MLGGGTLVELRTVLIEAELAEEGGVSPRVSPAAELARCWRVCCSAPVLRCRSPIAETITVTYPDALALMRDLRGMGETNALDGAPAHAAAPRHPRPRRPIYAERFGLADGRIPATFEILFLTGWAPEMQSQCGTRYNKCGHKPIMPIRIK